jgi:hypothetical protein
MIFFKSGIYNSLPKIFRTWLKFIYIHSKNNEMIIGIIIHFKVKHETKQKWMNSNQFTKWIETYNNSEIIPPKNVKISGSWDTCYSSDLKRSELAAKLLYNGKIIITNDLREIGLKILQIQEIKLHYNIWLIIGRIMWYFSKNSQEETRYEAISRAKKFVDLVEKSNYSNILIVSHGAFMKYLNSELKQRKY